MRSVVYESRVIFRDCEEVVAALKAKAGRENLTFAELMRRAARREVGAIVAAPHRHPENV